MKNRPQVNLEALRGAFTTTRLAPALGWSFAKALEVPTVRWALENLARIRHQPVQLRLFP